jgi:hypothetical protein
VVRAPVGGSDGVGITLKEWAAQVQPDALVVGSRGLGTLSRCVRACVRVQGGGSLRTSRACMAEGATAEEAVAAAASSRS